MPSFDPNSAAADDAGIFGLPYTYREASLVYLPVPWEVTTSYGGGTSQGPAAILEASKQVDLYDYDVEKPYEAGLFFQKESSAVRKWNQDAKKKAQKIIDLGGEIPKRMEKDLKEVNALSEKLNEYVYEETKNILKDGKIPAIVGGDHSVPFGAIEAMAERASFGILHFDAHSDTRKAYEGFTWSHASIMYNVLEKIPHVERLVQVGIRDFCEEEWNYCKRKKDRVRVYFDGDLNRRKFEGVSWKSIAGEIVSHLPQQVWVSFDIDGLDPRFCPHTGTPVPGGLDFQEANYILAAVVQSGRKILGFDLNEVSPGPKDEWDANVGARMLYKMSAWTLVSQNKATRRAL